MAIADAPARALVIYGDGLVPSLSPSHSHLHALAASGACGFLALRDLPPHVGGVEREVYELQQLLDVHEAFIREAADEGFLSNCKSAGDGARKQRLAPCISERFMGMKAAMATTSKPAANLGKSLGFWVTMMDELEAVDNRFNGTTVSGKRNSKLPVPSMVASQLLDMLGLGDPPSKGMDTFELILLHVGATPDDNSGTAIPENLDWINALIGEIKSLMQMGTKAANHLYLALVMGYGDTAIIHDRTDVRQLPSLEKLDALPPELKAIRPRQTYTMKDGNPVNNVRNHHPLLVVHQMDGVTRRDATQILSFEEFQKWGGSLTILADRFLYEIAFKLWKAPKYGA